MAGDTCSAHEVGEEALHLSLRRLVKIYPPDLPKVEIVSCHIGLPRLACVRGFHTTCRPRVFPRSLTVALLHDFHDHRDRDCFRAFEVFLYLLLTGLN